MTRPLHPAESALREPARPIDQIARGHRLDERIARLVPGFDAPFFQAGLAGYSDGAMRLIARRHGCPYCVTEALLDRTLISGGKGRAREDPELLHDHARTGQRGDHPIAGQLMGTDPDEMAEAASILVTMNYDVVDVNLACPVRKIRRRNRGGHFLAYPDEAIALLRAVRDAVGSQLPTTVKLRRAWDETPEMAAAFERIFDAAYELGYAWATVHCRTVEQRYDGPGRWSFLADLVRRSPDRLIFGSGDIWSAGDIFAMLDATGVQAVSVARGCIGNPWIFRQARQLMAGAAASAPTIDEQRNVLLAHFDLAVRLHGERPASRMMRKFGIRFSAHHPNAEAVRQEFIRCASIADWRSVIDRHYAGQAVAEPAGA